MMMDKMNRRAFLKSAGTVALAVAAAGVLTACGEDAPAPSVEFKATKLYTTISYSDSAMTQITGTNVAIDLEVKNGTGAEIKLTKDLFAMELEGKSASIDIMRLKVPQGYTQKDEIPVKPGETVTIALVHHLEAKTKEELSKWVASAGKMKVTVKYGGLNKTFEADIRTGKIQ